jgi:hypothetical protein
MNITNLIKIIKKYYVDNKVVGHAIDATTFKIIIYTDDSNNSVTYTGTALEILQRLDIPCVSITHYKGLFDQIDEIESRKDITRKERLKLIMPIESEIEYYVHAEKV